MIPTFFRSMLAKRIESYRRLQPRLISTLVVMSAAVTSAVVAIAYAKAVDWATDAMREASVGHSVLFIALAPLWMCLAYALVRFFDPTAGGSGIPQVIAKVEVIAKAGLAKTSAPLWQNLRLILVKVASSIAAVLGGGAVGREGPTIQISAAVFELFDSLFFKITGTRQRRDSLLIAGGAAGLAAAFNTPLGGVVFAIEELAKNHFKNFKGFLILGVVTTEFVTQAALGPYLFVGHVALGTVAWQSSLRGILIASILGVVGAIFGRVLFALIQFTKKMRMLNRLALAAACGLAMAVACVMMGTNASGGGSLVIRHILFENNADVSLPLAAWRVVGLVITYISGCAGGIFAPSLAAGAALGAKCAQWIGAENPNFIVVIGMISFLTGATRSPFTSFILVFEMTDRQASIVPMLASALVAGITARFVEEASFYEKTAEQLVEHDQMVTPATVVNQPAQAPPSEPPHV